MQGQQPNRHITTIGYKTWTSLYNGHCEWPQIHSLYD